MRGLVSLVHCLSSSLVSTQLFVLKSGIGTHFAIDVLRCFSDCEMALLFFEWQTFLHEIS